MNAKQIAEISTKIINKIAETGSVQMGFDAVMGEGAYSKLAGEIYDALNSK